MLRPRTLQRRLFAWLLVLALVPSAALLAAGFWAASGALGWTEAVGPWEAVGESGRALLDSLPDDVLAEPAVARAATRHRQELARSLMLARRWSFLARRLGSALPALALALAAVLAGLALLASRRIARELTRPLEELVGWSERLGREVALPPERPAEAGEASEIRALRAALRQAALERTRSRQRALENERMRTWGEMARRVAHEMKNPLTPLRLAVHRLRALPRSDEALAESVSVIEQETGHLEALAARFSELGRPPEGPSSEVDLAELLQSLLATDVPDDVAWTLHAAADAPRVEARLDPLFRAFRNVVRNAVDAARAGPSAPRITVDVTSDAAAEAASLADAASIAERSAMGGAGGAGVVRVAIRDSGPGLPAGAEARVFEPDYSTKTRGTGLGLALARQAVRQAGGDIGARNAPEGGAEFVVRLPAAPAPRSAALR